MHVKSSQGGCSSVGGSSKPGGKHLTTHSSDDSSPHAKKDRGGKGGKCGENVGKWAQKCGKKAESQGVIHTIMSGTRLVRRMSKQAPRVTLRAVGAKVHALLGWSQQV